MRVAALSLMLALAPESAACKDPRKVEPSPLTSSPGVRVPLQPCPPVEVCQDLERHRVDCKSGKPGGCDRFVDAFERLLTPCDCSDGDGRPRCTKPGLDSCFEVTPGDTHLFDAALATIAELARSKSSRAQRVFASQKFRDMLSGEYADVYFEDSVNTDRVLRGLPPRPPYQEPTLSATASSTLRPQAGNRYDPALALDGKLETAWCEGAREDGVGEWIEIRAQHVPDWRRPVCQVMIVPGYAKSEATYRQNGRVTRVRISSCAHPEAHVEADIEPYQANLPYPRVMVPFGALKGEADCFRLTILAVARGQVPDTCISEIWPIFCEPRAGTDGGAERR